MSSTGEPERDHVGDLAVPIGWGMEPHLGSARRNRVWTPLR